MAGNFSDFAEAAVLNALRGTAFSVTTCYLALFITATTDAGGGTEVTGGSYARVAITWGAPTVNGTQQQIANSVQLDFPTATVAWGMVVDGAIYDALAGGNMLVHGVAVASKQVNANDGYKVVVGALVVAID